MTPIGGGVDIQPLNALSAKNLLQDSDGAVQKVHVDTVLTDLVPGQWWWD